MSRRFFLCSYPADRYQVINVLTNYPTTRGCFSVDGLSILRILLFTFLGSCILLTDVLNHKTNKESLHKFGMTIQYNKERSARVLTNSLLNPCSAIHAAS